MVRFANRLTIRNLNPRRVNVREDEVQSVFAARRQVDQLFQTVRREDAFRMHARISSFAATNSQASQRSDCPN